MMDNLLTRQLLHVSSGGASTPSAPPAELQPVITLQPEIGLTVTAPTAFVLTVEATNAQSYQWRYISGDGAVPNGTSSTLTVDPSIEGTWGYYCVVTNVTLTAQTIDVFVTVSAASAWQLEAGHYLPESTTKMPLQIIYPRPEAELSSGCYAKNAYTGRAWEIGIDVQGGSKPFRYSIEGTIPSGMTIGEALVLGTPETGGTPQSDDGTHGTLRWANPLVGTHSVTVRVTGQDGNYDQVQFDLVVGTTGYVFVDATSGNDTTGDGTLANPYQTFHTGIYANQNGAGKVCEFLAGTYVIHDGSNGEAVLDSTLYPTTLKAADGAAVTFDMSVARIQVNSCHDFRSQGIDHDGYKSTSADWRCYFCNDKSDRVSWYKNTFDNMEMGMTGNDNPGCIVMWGLSSNPTPVHQYVSVLRNTSKSGMRIPMYTGFDVSDISLSKNIFLQAEINKSGGNTDFLLKFKGNHSDATMFDNSALALTSVDINVFVLGDDNSADTNTNQEMCYNSVYIDDPTGKTTSAAGYTQFGTGSAVNFISYRNSFINLKGYGARNLDSVNSNLVDIINDVMYGANADLLGVNLTETDNLKGLTPVTDFGTDCKLVGTTRDTYLGIRGHEVA